MSKKFPKELKEFVFNLARQGKKAKDILEELKKSDWKELPAESTLSKWIRNHKSSLLDKAVTRNDAKKEEKKVEKEEKEEKEEKKIESRKEWGAKDYEKKTKEQGETLNAKYKKLWSKFKFPEGYVYEPKDIYFIEYCARKEFHPHSFEDSLHLNIYQICKENSSAVRSKKGNKLQLTSQNHIFPDSKIKDKENSYEPMNVREGNAKLNIFIKHKIDPILEKFGSGYKISKATADILNKYNFKSPKEHISFKYTLKDRIVTSNILYEIPKSKGGSYEEPISGILNGPDNIFSLLSYSLPLYKISSEAGILDVCLSGEKFEK